MDALPPPLPESIPTPFSSSRPPELLEALPLSLEAYRIEVRRRAAERMGREAHEHAEEIRERCKTLHGFVKEAWGVLEPETKFSDNWHIDLICNHLEAVTRGEITRLLINVWPGPMRYDSQVETARGLVPLSDVLVGDLVLTHRGRYRPVSAVHEQGELPILKIVTHSGRETHAAPEHPYLTPRGWVDARDLAPGDILAVVNPQEDRPDAIHIAAEEARLLGYLVGDGSLTQATTGFTNGERDVIDDFRRCAQALGFETSESRRRSHWHVRLLGGAKVQEFLHRHGLWRTSSYTKRIPRAVMDADRETISNFMGAYWTCDGGFNVRSTRRRGSIFRAYAVTVSETLANDLIYALGMVGIEARLKRSTRSLETAAQPGGIYRYFRIEVQKEEMAGRFAELPGLCERKRVIAAQCRTGFARALWGDPIISIESTEPARCMCLTVEEDHSFVCSGIAVKNSMKSLITSVLWPAFEWGPAGRPGLRYISTSFNDGPVNRDTRKTRDLIMSEWYQTLWPEVALVRKGETSFSNSSTGSRQGVAFGSLTSQRGDRLIIDDPHSVETAESEIERNNTTRKFREGAVNRLNDQERSAIVIIMQRLHMDDLSGEVTKHPIWGYVHVILPMEFEPERAYRSRWGSDPRTIRGELADPQRFPRAAVEKLKESGEYFWNSQYLARPSPRAGGMFKIPENWSAPRDQEGRIVEFAPSGGKTVAGWDIAGSKRKTSPYSVRAKMKRVGGDTYILDVKRERTDPAELRVMVKETVADDGTDVLQSLPQDPGAVGKVVKWDWADMLAGFNFKITPETGDKETRAEAYAAQWNVGRVFLVRGPWNGPYIEELRNFPSGSYKDQVDASSRGFGELVRFGEEAGPGVAGPRIPHAVNE